MRNSTEILSGPKPIPDSELQPEAGGVSEPISRSRLTRSISGGILNHPLESGILAFTTLYLGFQVVRGLPNFNANLDKGENIAVSNKAPVIHSSESVDRIRELEQRFGNPVIPTGLVGVRIIEPEGVNLRVFPNKQAGRIPTGGMEPYYEVWPFYAYDPKPIKYVSEFVKTANGIWAITWSKPDEKNGNLIYPEFFAVYDNGEWLADFIVEDQVIDGQVLFAPDLQTA